MIKINSCHPFKFSQKFYVLFDLNDTPDDFLWVYNEKTKDYSLFGGDDFKSKIKRIREEKDLCLECSLGTSVHRGVFTDGVDIVDFKMTIEEANDILKKLEQKLTELSHDEFANFVELFQKNN